MAAKALLVENILVYPESVGSHSHHLEAFHQAVIVPSDFKDAKACSFENICMYHESVGSHSHP